MNHGHTGLGAIEERIRSLEAAVAEMRRDLREQGEDLALLTRLLRGENGRDSVLTRLALAERILHDYIEQAKEVNDRLAAVTSENLKGRWSMAQGVMVALIAALGGIVSALATALMKGTP